MFVDPGDLLLRHKPTGPAPLLPVGSDIVLTASNLHETMSAELIDFILGRLIYRPGVDRFMGGG